MEIVRDLIRDLVGILFPGGLLVIFTLLALWAVIVPFYPSTPFTGLLTGNSVIVLVIISYIAGQTFRMRQLRDLEKICTERYRKEELSDLKRDWKTFVKEIDQKERDYFSDESNTEKLKELKEAYKEYEDTFKLWEEFPYGYRLTARRLLYQPEDYVKFFDKYQKQGLMNMKQETFFHFCKSVIYEYSPSFKEELLRQESMVRLFAGIYCVVRVGIGLAIITFVIHLVLASSLMIGWFKFNFYSYQDFELSKIIFGMSIFVLVVFLKMKREILERLRFMRVKELNLAHDGFYLICKKNNLNF